MVVAVVQRATDGGALDGRRGSPRTAATGWRATSGPKHFLVLDSLERSPAGKADYRLIKSLASAELTPAG